MKLIFTNQFSIENKGLEEKFITKLENLIIHYNSELLMGITYVDDIIYNNCLELLEMLRPTSPILNNDKSVYFIKNLNEEVVEELIIKLENFNILKFYLNPQGLNVRLIYEYGELKEAHTFGRSFKTQNVLDIMTHIFTNRNDSIGDLGHVEIEGVLTLPFDNMDMAKEFCGIKNPYQGVFSLLHANEINEEIDNLEDILHFIATDVFIKDLPFESINDKYETLECWEFLIPNFFEIERTENLIFDLEDALYRAENENSAYEYLTDGIRLLTNNSEIVLLKVGSWKITSFSAEIEKIEWIDKKCRKVPNIIFKYSIQVNDELEISNLILNNVNLLLILDIDINDTINFAYFGEMGILPITKNNEIILN